MRYPDLISYQVFLQIHTLYQNKFIAAYILELYNLPLDPYFSLIKCSVKL